MTEKEQHWVSIQIKGLSSWVNSYLKPSNIPIINDLQKDLQDGIKLNQFLSILSGTKINYDPNPQMKIHKIQNLSIAVNFAQENLKVRLIGISAEDIERGDIKLILGFIYTTFRTVRISKISTQLGETDKKKNEAQQLIAWMNTVVENEPYELKLDTFKDEPFRNGKAFGALLHSYNKDLFDYESMGDNDEENLKKIFEIYEQKLGIPQLLDVSEVMNGTVDERAMTLYSSLIYHAHASQEERRKLQEGNQTILNEHITTRKELQEKYDQLLKDKEEIDKERERLRLEKEKEEEMRKLLEKQKQELEDERERLRKEKEEMERLKNEQEKLRKLAENQNQDLSNEKDSIQKQREKEEEERKRLLEENKRLLAELQNGLSNEINLRDQMLYLYQCLMDERYNDIENYLRNDKKGGSGESGNNSNNSSEFGNESISGSGQGNDSSSSKTRTTRNVKGGENGENGDGDEGQSGEKGSRNRITRQTPTENTKIDLTTNEGIEKEKKRNSEMQKRLERELDELKEKIKQEIQRRKKDSLKLQQYEEKLKDYESKAIEQGEANRALDILKKNLTDHVEDLKVWLELSELDLNSEKQEKYDPTLIRANLKDKKFEEQIDYLAEQLQGENESMRRILEIKDSKKQLYDTYSDKQGSLLMKTDESGEWKNQWFVLKAFELSYYPTEEKKDRAGGVTINLSCSVSSEKKTQYKGQTIYPILIKLEGGNQIYVAAPTKKAKKEWFCVLKGKIIYSEYMHQIEESKTRPDIRLNNVLFATVDLGSIRMDNSPLSKYTVSGIAQALSSFDDLNVVTFSNSEFTDELASVLAPSLKNAFIRSLNFSDNHLTSEGAKLIVDSFSDNRSLETIDFSGNEIGDESSSAIASLISKKKVYSIDFENNKITSEGAKKILESLVDHPKWTNLQFNGNLLGDEGCKHVAHLISKNSTITEVQLSRNRISDDGVKELCSVLKDNTSVTDVDLSGNLLSQISISYINELLKENKTIRVLNLSSNPQIIGGKNLEGVFSNESFSLSSFSLLRVI